MKKMINILKKASAVLLAFCMLPGILSVSAAAAENDPFSIKVDSDGSNLVVSVIAEEAFVNGAIEGRLSWDNTALGVSDLSSIESDMTFSGEAADLYTNKSGKSYKDTYFAIYADDLENGDSIEAGTEIVRYVFDDVSNGDYTFTMKFRDAVNISGEKYSFSDASFISDKYTKTDYRKAVITKEPEDCSTVEGSRISFSVEAQGDGLSYQWFYSKNGSRWSKTSVSGCRTNKIVMPASLSKDGYSYRVKITDAGGNVIYSRAAKVTVIENPVSFSSQPLDASAMLNKTASFKAPAVSSNGGTITYQWYYSADKGRTWRKTTLSGCRTSVLKVKAISARSGYRYRCIASDEKGFTAISDSAVLTVNS